MDLITISRDRLIELLEKAAETGITTADTAGDYTAAGIAYYAYIDYIKENDNG